MTLLNDAVKLKELTSAFQIKYSKALVEIHKDVLELDDMTEQMFVAILAGGHVLLEGEPGVGKTLLATTIAKVIQAKCTRIQFTPEIRPSHMYYSLGSLDSDDKGRGKTLRDMRLAPGPLFTQILIGDEISRGYSGALAALLEPLEEQQITLEGQTISLGAFYFLAGTQNPVESAESTNELPEALQERLMLKIYVPYPSAELLRRIAIHDTRKKDIHQVLTVEDIVQTRELIFDNYVLNRTVNDPVIGYMQRIITGIHDHPAVVWGPGIRAAQDIARASAARAFLHGRNHIGFADVRYIAYPALRFKFLRDERQIRKLGLDIRSNDDVIRDVLATVPLGVA